MRTGRVAMNDTHVRVRSVTKANAAEVRTGLLAYLSIECANLVLDGVTLRRTRDGELRLSFPMRTDAHGRRHAIIRPADDRARRAIERAVLPQLRWREDAT